MSPTPDHRLELTALAPRATNACGIYYSATRLANPCCDVPVAESTATPEAFRFSHTKHVRLPSLGQWRTSRTPDPDRRLELVVVSPCAVTTRQKCAVPLFQRDSLGTRRREPSLFTCVQFRAVFLPRPARSDHEERKKKKTSHVLVLVGPHPARLFFGMLICGCSPPFLLGRRTGWFFPC